MSELNCCIAVYSQRHSENDSLMSHKLQNEVLKHPSLNSRTVVMYYSVSVFAYVCVYVNLFFY